MKVRWLLLSALFALVAACGSSQTKPTWMPITCLETAAQAAQRPPSFAFSCDGHTTFNSVRWSNWGQASATGTGTLDLEGRCTPSCSTAPLYRYAVRIVASQVALCGRQGHARRVYGLVTAYLGQPDISGAKKLSRRLESCTSP
jgi:hypothetical protein